MKQSIIILFFVFILGCTNSKQTPPLNQVFYSSFRPEGWEIYISKDNGQTFNPLTSHESLDYDAKISPDANWVVFTSERAGKPQLYIKNVQTEDKPRLLVNSNSMQDQVDFSPDGKWIVFVSTHNGQADIYKLPFRPMDMLEISKAQNLTNHASGDFRPSFSNDGTQIAFSSDRDHPIKPHKWFPFAMQRTGDIYRMTIEGDEVTRLTDSDSWEGSPTWSLDDKEIIFYSVKTGTPQLYKMSKSGANQELISPEKHTCFSPVLISETHILFTNMDEETKGFSILKYNTETKQIDSSLVQKFDMFNVDYHESGLFVFHGGKKPENTDRNMGGFEGDLLVQNSPEKATISDRKLNLFGVRRAFAAPPTTDGRQIVYDQKSDKNTIDFYSEDYENNTVNKLFSFEVDTTLYSSRARAIDMKFTPDGESLQFTLGGFRGASNEPGGVYLYNFNTKNITPVTDSIGNNGFADFSMNNKTMVFRSGRTGKMDIYVQENGELTNITNNASKENFPVISHDGNTIAYCSDISGKDIDGKVKTVDIYIRTRKENDTWAEPKQLTFYKGQEGHPHFSPDGKWLIYTSEEFGINDEQPLVQPVIFSPQMYGEITVIRLKDGLKFRLTHNKWEDGAPLWITEN
jgi:Tol biopolymer transport system component